MKDVITVGGSHYDPQPQGSLAGRRLRSQPLVLHLLFNQTLAPQKNSRG